jgi:hypothetical protein
MDLHSYFPSIALPLNQVALVKYKLEIVTRHDSKMALNCKEATFALLTSEKTNRK